MIIGAPFFLMLFKSGRRMIGTALMIVVLLLAFQRMRADKFEMSTCQQEALARLVDDAVARFPWREDTGMVTMITDKEAWEPNVTDAIRAKVKDYQVGGGRKFDIRPQGFLDRLARMFGFSTAYFPLTDEKISRLRNRLGEKDSLLIVRLGEDDYKESENKVSCRLECLFYLPGKSNAQRIVSEVAFDKRVDMYTHAGKKLRAIASAKKFFGIVVFTLLFPFLMAPITLSIVKKRSGSKNAIMVASYAIIDYSVLLALFGWPVGWLQSLFMVIMVIAILWYMLAVCDIVAVPSFSKRLQSIGNYK